MKISDYLLNRDKYVADETYQRPANVWSRKDEQCFIDTIMRSEPIPIFFLNYKTAEDIHYIVDGQQRMTCIKDFADNKFPLSKEFSDESLDGKKFKDLSTSERAKFQNYNLSCKIMTDYDDERVRMIFSRLQRGKPLGLGEKLNAKPGQIVDVMRDLSKHDFISKSIGINKQRYHTYEDVARMIFYETFGAKDSGTNALYDLFDRYKNDITIGSRTYNKIQNVLNYLLKCFPAEPGDYQYLSKHAWVLTVYCAISDLRDTYALNGREADIAKWIKNFHTRVYSEDWRQSDIKLQRFYDNIRGGWSEKLNEFRKNTLKEYMIRELSLIELDDDRQISDDEKITVYGRVGGCCQKCGKEFKDYKEAEYHHIDMHSLGGPSQIDNIMVLCTKCHDDIHRKEAVDVQMTEADDIDEEE